MQLYYTWNTSQSNEAESSSVYGLNIVHGIMCRWRNVACWAGRRRLPDFRFHLRDWRVGLCWSWSDTLWRDKLRRDLYICTAKLKSILCLTSSQCSWHDAISAFSFMCITWVSSSWNNVWMSLETDALWSYQKTTTTTNEELQWRRAATNTIEKQEYAVCILTFTFYSIHVLGSVVCEQRTERKALYSYLFNTCCSTFTFWNWNNNKQLDFYAMVTTNYTAVR